MTADGAITVAIDGPAGAGKSTVAKEVAQALGFVLVDTGAIYRSVALLAQRQGVVWEDEAALEPIVQSLAIAFSLENGVNHVFLGTEDITDAIRTRAISRGAAAVSAHPGVRAGLLEMQRHLAGQGSAVLEGRDIGTVVCPAAQVKFFLDATPQERARRRYEELLVRGEAANLDDVLEEIQVRDALDRARAYAPLRAADDAVHLDSTQLSAAEVIKTIVAAVRQCISGMKGPRMSQDTQTRVAQIFATDLPQRLIERPRIVPEVDAAYKFVITGAGGGSWRVDLTAPGGKIFPSDAEAPCTITVAAADFLDLMDGKVNPQMAFLAGKLKVAGDFGLALKLGAIFG